MPEEVHGTVCITAIDVIKGAHKSDVAGGVVLRQQGKSPLLTDTLIACSRSMSEVRIRWCTISHISMPSIDRVVLRRVWEPSQRWATVIRDSLADKSVPKKERHGSESRPGQAAHHRGIVQW